MRALLTDETRLQIHRSLAHLICPDCLKHGMLTRRVSGRRTLFVCQECPAMFEMDWAGVFNENVEIIRMETCPLCEGRGRRYVRLPPYTDSSTTKLQTCCDCDGSGRRKVKEQ